MKRLMRLHRYLSCFVAPAMLFFAVSGIWQTYRLQETRKDGSYAAPVALQVLSEVHKAEHLSGPGATWFRLGMALLAASFVATALVGLTMAFRVTRPVWLVWLCLLGGSALPVLLALAARRP